MTGLPFIGANLDQESPALLIWSAIGIDCGFSGVLEFDPGAARALNGYALHLSPPLLGKGYRDRIEIDWVACGPKTGLGFFPYCPRFRVSPAHRVLLLLYEYNNGSGSVFICFLRVGLDLGL